MSQELKEGMKTDYCPWLGIRVATGKDNICVACLPRTEMEGEMVTMRGVVVNCTNGDGELVSNKKENSLLNNLEGMRRSERVAYFMNLAKIASQWINSGKNRIKKSVI